MPAVYLFRACPNNSCPLAVPGWPGGPRQRHSWAVRATPDHGVNVPIDQADMSCPECGWPSVPEDDIDLTIYEGSSA